MSRQLVLFFRRRQVAIVPVRISKTNMCVSIVGIAFNAGLIARDRPIVTTELKDEMLRRVSGTTVADYLGYFEELGYTPSLLEKGTGAEKPYDSVAELLADWGETDELRDVLLLPRPARTTGWRPDPGPRRGDGRAARRHRRPPPGRRPDGT